MLRHVLSQADDGFFIVKWFGFVWLAWGWSLFRVRYGLCLQRIGCFGYWWLLTCSCPFPSILLAAPTTFFTARFNCFAARCPSPILWLGLCGDILNNWSYNRASNRGR